MSEHSADNLELRLYILDTLRLLVTDTALPDAVIDGLTMQELSALTGIRNLELRPLSSIYGQDVKTQRDSCTRNSGGVV